MTVTNGQDRYDQLRERSDVTEITAADLEADDFVIGTREMVSSIRLDTEDMWNKAEPIARLRRVFDAKEATGNIYVTLQTMAIVIPAGEPLLIRQRP